MIRARRSRQSGRTLLEVTIALAIGLSVSTAVLLLFVSTRGVSRTQTAGTEVDDAGRYAIAVLSRELRQAGFQRQAFYDDSWMRPPADDFVSVFGCSGGFVDPAAAVPACVGVDGAPDAVLIRRATEIREGATPAARTVDFDANSGRGTDCLGVRVPNPATPATADFLVENRFYVARSANGVPELYCRGSAANDARPIASGVEDLRLVYAVDQLDGGGTRDFSTDALRSALDVQPEQWQWSNATGVRSRRVLGVQICLLMRSSQRAEAIGTQQLTDCRGVQRSFSDGFMRRVVRSTVVMRNHLL